MVVLDYYNNYRVFTPELDESTNVQCNTEKDKEKLHHRTAGTCTCTKFLITAHQYF